jgi:hypothetical protein
MELMNSSETIVNFHRITRSYVPDDGNVYSYCTNLYEVSEAKIAQQQQTYYQASVQIFYVSVVTVEMFLERLFSRFPSETLSFEEIFPTNSYSEFLA